MTAVTHPRPPGHRRVLPPVPAARRPRARRRPCSAPDAELSVAGANFVPWTGPRSGPAEIRQFLDSAASEVQTDEFVIDRVMADGEDGIALGHFTHRVRRTGRRFACRFALHVKVSGGLIRSYFMFEDSYAIAEAFRG